MNQRYGKRAKSASPLSTLATVILIVVILGAATVAAIRMGVFRRSEPAPEPETEVAAEDASVSHAPAASVIAPAFGTADDDTAEEVSVAAGAEEAVAQPESLPQPVQPALPGEGCIVCLDPGHGGKDPGCNTEARMEKDDVLKLALAIRDAMEKEGIQVIMTRADDTFILLDERCNIANEAGATYFISVHRNIFSDNDVYGNEVWKSINANEEASALADNIMSGLERAGIQRSRGVQIGSQDHQGDYAVLRNTKMPATLLEMGFVQNKKDNQFFDENMAAYADAITQAVLDTWDEYHVEPAEQQAEAEAQAEAEQAQAEAQAQAEQPAQ